MDKIIGKLHQRVAQKIAGSQLPGVNPQQFSQILDNKINNNPAQVSTSFQDTTNQKFLEKMSANLNSESKSDVKIIAADDIKINFSNDEFKKEVKNDVKNQFFSLFEDLNSDMLNINSAIEVLADPGVKLNKRQLLAYQAGIGNMTINSELFSRLAQTVAQNLNTLLNTNIG